MPRLEQHTTAINREYVQGEEDALRARLQAAGDVVTIPYKCNRAVMCACKTLEPQAAPVMTRRRRGATDLSTLTRAIPRAAVLSPTSSTRACPFASPPATRTAESTSPCSLAIAGAGGWRVRTTHRVAPHRRRAKLLLLRPTGGMSLAKAYKE